MTAAGFPSRGWLLVADIGPGRAVAYGTFPDMAAADRYATELRDVITGPWMVVELFDPAPGRAAL